MNDVLIEKLINQEKERQLNGIELIASENYVSNDVYEALGSVLTNKYAEGYPNHRYYGGCEIIDQVEQLAIDRANKLFNTTYANVQPHSGSQANRAVIEAVCNHGDTILSLDLNHGGHLTHGSPVSFSGMFYNIVHYGVNPNTGYIDYDAVEQLTKQHNPVLIIGGASAYSRQWDLARMRQIADSVGAVFMFDMAHIAGLVAAKLHQNPCDFAHIVTSTTHKTLRGPRGGIILMKHDFKPWHKYITKKDGSIKTMSEMIDSSVFPGNQGGPLENTIAAKAVCFFEAMQPQFIQYQKQVIINAKALAEHLKEYGFDIVSGGTDNHSFLIDLRSKYPNLTGKEAEYKLGLCGITVNKNMVPFDSRTPFTTSGLRIGTPAITTRGMTDMQIIADLINDALAGVDPTIIKKRVEDLTKQYSLFKW